MKDRFRSRKWILSCSIELFAMTALVMDKLSSDNFSNISVAVIASYSFANAAEYFRSQKDGS